MPLLTVAFLDMLTLLRRTDHAVLMVKFARSILREMNKLTKILEISLGPDTGKLYLVFSMDDL